LVQAFWISHDSSNLLLDISISLNITLLVGLLIWYGRRWRHFKIASESMQIVGWGGLAIYNYIQGNRWMAFLPAFLCVWAFLSFFEEIRMYKSLSKSEQTNCETKGKG